MKVVFFFIAIISFVSCSLKQRQLNYYLSSGIENIKIFPANKKDSMKIEEINATASKSLEECKRKDLNCIDDRGIMTLNADFLKGIYNFRKVLFENFKLSKNAKIGENRLRITIGINDNLENIKILKYTDEYSKKAIEEVFKLKELNTWKSAKIYGIPVKEEFEISIFIKQ